MKILKYISISIVLLLSACNSKTENNTSKNHHKSYMLTRSVKKGAVFTNEMYTEGMPVLISVRAEPYVKEKDDEGIEEPIIDDEIKEFIGRRFKRSYNVKDVLFQSIYAEMFEKK